MTWDWHWIGSFKGTPFTWGDFRYNSGDPYKSYRFGPLLIRVFLKGVNQDRLVRKASGDKPIDTVSIELN